MFLPLLNDDLEGIIATALEDLGLTPGESSVMGCLLRDPGAKQATAIAKQIKMNRTHIYGLLERLVQRGLVSVNEREGTKWFTALSVEDLTAALREKEKAIERRRKQLAAFAGSSQLKPENLWKDPVTRSFKGAEARARLFQELVEGEDGVLICLAEGSCVLDGAAASRAGLEQLLYLMPPQIQIIVASKDSAAFDLAAALNSPRLTPFQGDMEAELLIKSDKVMLIGRKGELPCFIAVEQRALAQSLVAWSSAVISAHAKLVAPKRAAVGRER